MNQDSTALTIDNTVSAAQELLASRFGGTPELTHPEDLGGNGAALVLRARVAQNDFLPERTVVVKQLPPADPDARQVSEDLNITLDEAVLFRELVAYQFTNSLAEEGRPGPQLLAYDIEKRLLVLSDLGDGKNFTDVINHFDADDRLVALRKLGRALGRMHVATAGREEAYVTLLRRQCQRHGISSNALQGRDLRIDELIKTGVKLLTKNKVPIDPVVVDFANYAADRQNRVDIPAFTPFDLTPDNLLLTNRVYFLDYEWAGFRDIAFDVACVVAGFPQDTSTPALTDEETDEFIAAWRVEITQMWPEYRDDDELYAAIMASLIGWAFFSLALLYYGPANLSELEEFNIGGDDLKNLTNAQLVDLATTLEAIQRFAMNHDRPGYPVVGELTKSLLAALARLGATPQERGDG